ncbi:MAG TPA: DUF2723 domain-containing protein [Candidatus Latescibacteria bacterium]|nr:DUF2723 domain-containing protein [Candidatus Latescibacterota bacterium]
MRRPWRRRSVGSGELITSACKLGIAHPTGYPLYCTVPTSSRCSP